MRNCNYSQVELNLFRFESLGKQNDCFRILFVLLLVSTKKLRWYCLKTENDSRCWKTQLVLLFLVDLFTEDICFVKSGSVMRDRWSFLLTAWSKIIDRSKRWIGDRWSLIDFGELILDQFFPPLESTSISKTRFENVRSTTWFEKIFFIL